MHARDHDDRERFDRLADKRYEMSHPITGWSVEWQDRGDEPRALVTRRSSLLYCRAIATRSLSSGLTK